MNLASSVVAQVRAEVLIRLRSASTLVALAAMLAGCYFWIPDPSGKATSLSWKTADGTVRSALYSAAYLGTVVAIVAGVFIILVGFYLVAGSVRRDRDCRVGAIVASTPISGTAYLLGKLTANAAYLAVLCLMALPIGLLTFLRYGTGPFQPGPFLLPFLLVAPGGVLFVAAMAVLFDVTPGLRGRGGLVIWFFVSALLLIGVPEGLARDPRTGDRLSRHPVFDPAATVSLEILIRESVPEAQPNSFSTGLIIMDEPIVRVPWRGLAITGSFVARRAAGCLWAVLPFGLAVLLFDRFDPSRQRLGARAHRRMKPRKPEEAMSAPAIAGGRAEAAPLHISSLTPVEPRPSTLAAVLAETRLIWDTASWVKWPLALAGIAAAVVPGEAAKMAAAAFLLLLVPVISEVAAREELAGARGLVFSQPGVPRSAVLWKLAAVALFLHALALPMLVGSLASPARAFALVTGLLFVAACAVGAASLTGGGKLFSAAYLALWYAAASNLPAADFCGVFGGALGAGARLAYLGIGAALIVVALARESRRALGR